MQDRYVGDLGDFGKYGLLRALSRSVVNSRELIVGVVWYLVGGENANGDGSRIGYLSLAPDRAAVFRNCDPVLFDSLQRLVTAGNRNVKSVSEAGILPVGTVFYERLLDFKGVPRTGYARREHRAKWLREARQLTARCDLIFLDPDNGLGNSIAAHSKQGVKYAYVDEVKTFLEQGKSIVLYQHIGRQGGAREQIARQFSRLGVSGDRSAFALLYHRGTARAFVVIESQADPLQLLLRAQHMLSGPWSRHFDLVPA